MATIRREITLNIAGAQAWEVMQDIGALHTRLVPGFVVGTKLEPGARVVTFANGMTVRERIVTIDHDTRRLVWSATGDRLSHHNASAQICDDADGRTRIIWIADLLPDSLADAIAQMMDDGMAAMQTALEK